MCRVTGLEFQGIVFRETGVEFQVMLCGGHMCIFRLFCVL